ncbi:DPP IV N-terminal domain-containing protein [Gracilimonas sp.]|uniref:S9 family peptidase n=1 Tax=Gracilimonas sp. TaxID=1974203 RepID=UPI002871B36D|nr:DPP IV N-terminal domain-containing protein [Gracilimonas sp.]
MNTSTIVKSVLSAVLMTFIMSPVSNAQNANFEAAERFTGDKMSKIVGSTSVYPRWIEDTDNFWYTYENNEGKQWYYVDSERPRQRLLFDQNEMASQLTEIFERPFNALDLDLEGFEYDADKERFTFHVDSIKFTYNIDGNELIKGDSLESEERERWATYSPDSTYIAFAKNHNLYLMRADDPDSTEIQLTDDGERWFSYQASQGDTTSDERLRSRVQFFDDETKLWVQRTDNREVEELWVINTLGKRPELETYKYGMPGDDEIGIDHVEVFDIESRERTRMDTDKWEDQDLRANYGGHQTGDYKANSSDKLYIYRENRKSDKVDILIGDTETGETEVLLSETSEPYFNWSYQYFGVINDGEEYLWWSERTGWGQLYLYDSEGNLKNQITSGNFVVGNVVKVDTTAKTIYFEGYGRDGDNPYYEHLYSVKFNGSDFKHLTPENANHSVYESDEDNYFVDNYSTVDQPTKSVLRDEDGDIILNLQEVDVTKAEEIGWQTPEEFKIKAADGFTDLYGVMWKPFDFDSTKNYPIISYVYPGPQTEPFPTSFSVSGMTGRNQALSQLGFVVVAFGQRGGSPERSRYYHTYGYGDLRDYPLADNKYGIEQLAARHSFIDQDKVGIFGHSGGGFMSTAALLTYPEFYDVAVSSAGNHDNNIYNTWWSETHHGVKENRKTVTEMNEDSVEVEKEIVTFDGSSEANAELAKNLQGRLLLVHGNIDNNVHPANTLRLADALIKAGKRFDMMILPGRRHGFGPYQPYFERQKWYYFAEHLLGDYRTNIDFNIPEDE